jgi:hypothetical protein
MRRSSRELSLSESRAGPPESAPGTPPPSRPHAPQTPAGSAGASSPPEPLRDLPPCDGSRSSEITSASGIARRFAGAPPCSHGAGPRAQPPPAPPHAPAPPADTRVLSRRDPPDTAGRPGRHSRVHGPPPARTAGRTPAALSIRAPAGRSRISLVFGFPSKCCSHGTTAHECRRFAVHECPYFTPHRSAASN